MKKAFIFILLFFLTIHFIIPGIYYWRSGYFSIYVDIDDHGALMKSFFLNAISILLVILLIIVIPSKKDQISPNIYNITPLYYFSLIANLALFYMKGGFAGAITGSMAGSFFNYLSLFLNPSIILMILLFYQKKKYAIGPLLLSFTLYVTATGSRSAIILLLLMMLIYPGFENFNRYAKKMKRYAIIFLIASPIMFIIASRSRGIDLDLLNNDIVLKAIFGRLSMIELGAIPIHFKDVGNFDIDLFYDKFGIWHQIKLMIDSLIPGNIFEFDVMPNQYYRALFMDYSVEYVQENYVSLNMTLPVYFYMFTGSSVMSVLLFVITLLGYYFLWKKYSQNIIISTALISQLYTFLYCFDFVMFFSQVTTTIFSILMVKLFIFLRKEWIKYVKNKPAQQSQVV